MSSLVSGAQDQLQAQNGRHLLFFTTGIVSNWESSSACYGELSAVGMNDKNYFAKTPPPVAIINSIAYAGFQAFVNLKTGILMGKDEGGSFITNSQIISWATEANE